MALSGGHGSHRLACLHQNLRSAPRMAATIDRQAEGYRGALIMN